MAPLPLTSEFMGMASYAPTYFLDIMDDDVRSDGSSIGDVAPSHRPSREYAMADAPGQPPVVADSVQTHILRTRVWGPSRSHKGTSRSYNNGGKTSRRLRRRARCSTLGPMRMTRRATPRVASPGSTRHHE